MYILFLLRKNLNSLSKNQNVTGVLFLFCCLFGLTSCDLLTPKPLTPSDESAKRAICEAIVLEDDCMKSDGCEFFKQSKDSGKCKLQADSGKSCHDISKSDCDLTNFSKQNDCFVFIGECRSDDDFDGNGFDKVSGKHRNTGTFADPTGRNIKGILIAAPAPVLGAPAPVLGVPAPVLGVPAPVLGAPVLGAAPMPAAAAELGAGPAPGEPPVLVPDAIQQRWDAFEREIILQLERDNPALLENEIQAQVRWEVQELRNIFPGAFDNEPDDVLRGDYRHHILGRLGRQADPQLNPEPRGIMPEHNHEQEADFQGATIFEMMPGEFLDVDRFDFTIGGNFAPAQYRNVWGNAGLDTTVDMHGFDQRGLYQGMQTDPEGYTRIQRTRTGGRQENGRIVNILVPDGYGHYLTGFNNRGLYRDFGVYQNEIGFRHSGINVITMGPIGPDGRDFLGYDARGFNYLGIHKNGTRYNSDGPDGEDQRGQRRNQPRNIHISDACRIVLGPGQEIIHFPDNYPDAAEFINDVEIECQKLVDTPLVNHSDTMHSMRSGLRLYLAGTHVHPNLPPSYLGNNGYTIDMDRNAGNFLRKYTDKISIGPRKSIQSVHYLEEVGVDAGGLRREFKSLIAHSFTADNRTEQEIREGNFNKGPMFVRTPGRMHFNTAFGDFKQCSRNNAKGDCWRNIGRAFAHLTFYEPEGVPTVSLPYGTLAQILNRPLNTFSQLLAAAKLDDPELFAGMMLYLGYLPALVVDLEVIEFEGDVFDKNAMLAHLTDNLSKKYKTDENKRFVEGFIEIAPFVREPLYDLNPAALALIIEGIPITIDDVEAHYQFAGIEWNEQSLDEDSFRQSIRELYNERVGDDEKLLFLKKLLLYWTGSSSLPSIGTKLKINYIQVEEQEPNLREALLRANSCDKKLYILQNAEMINVNNPGAQKNARKNALKETLRDNIYAPLGFNRM